MLRIGKVRDGSKVGVYLYCQEHAGEIATSGVCLETAERLVRNYGTDPETTELVDNLDIFIVPQINGDGAIHSIYDSAGRKNMVQLLRRHDQHRATSATRRTATAGASTSTATSRSARSSTASRARDTSCPSGNYAGPFELSEPETRNEIWVQTTFTNIKFVEQHPLLRRPTSCGRPAPTRPTRVALPYPPYGTLNFFDQTARHVLDGIKTYRGTAILPQQTGPVIDVLYSAAGNSADEAYYTHGIIGYDFEIGDHRYYKDPAPASRRPAAPVSSRRSATRRNPCLANEGFDEAMEFANGNYGLLQSALRLLEGHDAAGRRHGRPASDVPTARYTVKFTVQRGVLDLLHDRRLDAHDGLDRVEAAARPRAAAAGRSSRAGHDAQVDRARLQGQHLRGQVAGPRHRSTRPAPSAAPCRRRWR